MTASPLNQAAGPISFGVATEPDEFAQIRRLNYRTFVEEIPQHEPNDDGVLVDKFEGESTFVVARAGRNIVGMIAMRERRPFSLDGKLPDLDRYLPPGRRPMELRLLAVDKAFRGTAILRRLLEEAFGIAEANGFDLGVISGTLRQVRLYQHMGFVPFGPLVGTPGAEYQPMYAKTEMMHKQVGHLLAPGARAEPANFMPGPVGLTEPVRRRLAEPLVSHRGEPFLRDLGAVREALRALIGARHVAVCTGSGTLANDVVAAQIALSGKPAVVVVNGEFGERLADHARRHAIPHVEVALPWGAPVTDEALDSAFARLPGADWLWAVHCETSTGMLHDLPQLLRAATRHGAKLALDAISSVGTVDVDITGVALATTTSGKGIGAAPGVALVCSDEAALPGHNRVPRYLDLALYLDGDGVPFTQPSPLVGALAAALTSTDWAARFSAIREAQARLRARLKVAGIEPIVSGPGAAPSIVTFAVPEHLDADAVGARLESDGFLLGWRSGYMRDRRWLQVALMGDFPRERVGELGDAIARSFA